MNIPEKITEIIRNHVDQDFVPPSPRMITDILDINLNHYQFNAFNFTISKEGKLSTSSLLNLLSNQTNHQMMVDGTGEEYNVIVNLDSKKPTINNLDEFNSFIDPLIRQKFPTCEIEPAFMYQKEITVDQDEFDELAIKDIIRESEQKYGISFNYTFIKDDGEIFLNIVWE